MATPLNYTYMMEGPGEEDRLCFKDDEQATLSQLLDTGISNLPHNPFIVDAGTGVGVAAVQMANLLNTVYQRGTLSLLDGSALRLRVAADRLGKQDEISIESIECELSNIPLPDNTADYIFCRFVFEYLTQPEQVFDELTRILKPGGKLVIGDLDHNCLNHYPFPDELQSKLDELVTAIQNIGFLDFYAGRKLYSYFYKKGFNNINVGMYPHHLFYGDLKNADYENWRLKLERLIDLQKAGKLKLGYELAEFKDQYLDFLLSPERFSYTPLIMVDGNKP